MRITFMSLQLFISLWCITSSLQYWCTVWNQLVCWRQGCRRSVSQVGWGSPCGVGAPSVGGAITSSGSCRHQPGAHTPPECSLCATRIARACPSKSDFKHVGISPDRLTQKTIPCWQGMEINSDGFRSRVEWIGFAYIDRAPWVEEREGWTDRFQS